MAIQFPRRTGRLAQRPEMFEAWAPRFPSQNGSLASAVKGLVSGYRSVAEAHGRFSRDESATPGARLVKSARNARTKLEPLMDALDAAMGNAKAHADQLRAKLQQTYRPPNPSVVDFMLGQEIRAHFKSLPRAQVASALEAASKAGDHETLMAVCAYPATLAGVPPELHQWARDQLIAAKAPDVSKMLKELNEQMEFADQFKAEMLSSVAEMIDMEKVREIEFAAQVDAA